MPTRRDFLAAPAASVLLAAPAPGVKRYVRFKMGSSTGYGLIEGDTVRRFNGNFLERGTLTAARIPLKDLRLLPPVVPGKVLAVGLNYKSHLGSRTPPVNPEMFYKPVSCLIGPGEPIVIPKDGRNAHYEGELVVVVGKKLRNASREEAAAAIFGVTCGNDVSERDWQNGEKKDLQWWRAKGADTFGPLGPVLVAGLDHSKLMLETRLNGKVVQKQSTADLLFDCPACLSFISRYVTLEPGDVVYTGTPGSTQRMSPGDTVEVEIEGIGILKNPVVG